MQHQRKSSWHHAAQIRQRDIFTAGVTTDISPRAGIDPNRVEGVFFALPKPNAASAFAQGAVANARYRRAPPSRPPAPPVGWTPILLAQSLPTRTCVSAPFCV